MIRRAGTHLRQHSIAYVALFVALSGTALALPGRNTVDSGDIRPNAVKGKDAKESSFKGVVKGNAKVVHKAAFSNQVGFLSTPVRLIRIPHFGVVRFIYCGAENGTETEQIRIQVLSDDGAPSWFVSGSVISSALANGTGKPEHIDFGSGSIGSGGGEPYIAKPGDADLGLGLSAKWDFEIWRKSGHPRAAHVTVSGLNGSIVGSKCQVSAEATIFD